MNQQQRDELLEKALAAQTSTSARAWDVATKLAVPAVIGLVGWLWSHEHLLHNHEGRLDVIEDTRFSTRDASALEQRMYREFVSRMDAVTQQLATLVAEVRGLQQRLDREDR